VTIDGKAAGEILLPRSVAELSDCIKARKGSVVPMGAGTQLEFGNPLRSADTVVDLRGLNRVTTYNPAELTIHVEAGVTLGSIQDALAKNAQTLPLDPWNGRDATIGGIAAANAQGPLRATGSIRDWIIGMTVVHADGLISKTGGKVVKNVTGYDLAKLYTGSLGSLAVISEISFKLRPSFARTSTVVAEFESLASALEAVSQIRKSSLQPISCELTGPRHTVWVRFGEHPEAVEWQVSQLPHADWRRYDGEAEQAVWADLAVYYAQMGPIVIRLVGLPTQLADMIGACKTISWLAHALNGIVILSTDDAGAISRLRQRYPTVVERASAEVRGGTGTFGVQGRPKKLMLDIKQAMDPEGRLNPGRHIDGE
jgi:FAD/FMN-containing dehydrogenase